MSNQPFRCETVDDVLYLTLDTPGCAVNIFTRQAAAQLLDILRDVSPARVRAVVFASGKPGSFINGVGLMIASAVPSPEVGAQLTTEVRAAYRAVRDLPVPTVAAIRGNCYGCGVEFALQCDYRLAADAYDTHFYMTEIAEYLMIPAFGGTQDLPPLLGLERATDFLLWGERWSAHRALREGLIDVCMDDSAFDCEVGRFIAGLAPGIADHGRRSRLGVYSGADHEPHGHATRSRIEALPPMYQEVYLQGYELLEGAARKGRADDADYARELLCSGRSVTVPSARAALSFFFIRQLARRICLRGFTGPDTRCVIIDDPKAALTTFQEGLVARRLRDVTIVPHATGSDHPADGSTVRLRSHGHIGASPANERDAAWIDVRLAPVAGQVSWTGEGLLYAPLLAAGLPFAELATRGEPSDHVRALFAFLSEAGYHVVLSQPTSGFALNRLIGAYLAPLVAYRASGGSPDNVIATLRDFGFIRSPGYLVAAFGPEQAAAFLPTQVSVGGVDIDNCAALQELGSGTWQAGRVDRDLLDAVLLSLLAWVTSCREEGALHHPTLLDLAAREVLDFPVGRGSLCRHLTTGAVAEILAHEGDLTHLLAPGVLQRAHDFAGRRHGLYR
jgi:enoyl-CoA hydratase/carnithine racemase